MPGGGRARGQEGQEVSRHTVDGLAEGGEKEREKAERGDGQAGGQRTGQDRGQGGQDEGDSGGGKEEEWGTVDRVLRHVGGHGRIEGRQRSRVRIRAGRGQS